MKKGFTIVELLIVIVVIGILAAISLVAYAGVQNRANDSSVQADLRNLKTKIESYNAEVGNYPSNDAAVMVAATGFRANKASYAVQGTTNHNLIYCYGTNALSYAVVALSKSGKSFYVTNNAAVTAFAVNWTSQTTACTSVLSTYVTNLRGYAADDTVTGPWRSWTNGS